MRRSFIVGVLGLTLLLSGCSDEDQQVAPSLPPAPPQTPEPRPTGATEPTIADSPTQLIAEVPLAYAELVGLTDSEPVGYRPGGAQGVAGWWEYMFVALWVASVDDLSTLEDVKLVGEMEVDGHTLGRYESDDALMSTVSCGDVEVITGILGVDDNVIGTDPLRRYTQAVATSLC